MTLTVGLELRRDLTLGIGNLQESVTVAAEVQLVETTKAEVSTVVTQQQIASLPIEGPVGGHAGAARAGHRHRCHTRPAARRQRRDRRHLARRHELHRRQHEQHDAANGRLARGHPAGGGPGIPGHRQPDAGGVRRPRRRRHQRRDQERRQPVQRRGVRVLSRQVAQPRRQVPAGAARPARHADQRLPPRPVRRVARRADREGPAALLHVVRAQGQQRVLHRQHRQAAVLLVARRHLRRRLARQL